MSPSFQQFGQNFREKLELTEQLTAEIEGLPSPTPKEKDEPAERASYSKPKTQKINQLLRKIYEMEVSKREIKNNNAAVLPREERKIYFLKEAEHKVPRK